MKKTDVNGWLDVILDATRGPMKAFGDLKAKRALTKAVKAIREDTPFSAPKVKEAVPARKKPVRARRIPKG